MASRFTALPMSKGESFLLETDHGGKRWVMLFDGGQLRGVGADKNALNATLTKHCPGLGKHIDIAVCSHSDADHSGGFPDFVETWTDAGGTIGEFWLPSLWSPALPQALTAPETLVAAVYRGADEAAKMLVAPAAAMHRRAERAETIDARLAHLGWPLLAEARPFGDASPRAALPSNRDADGRAAHTARSLGLTVDQLDSVERHLGDSAAHDMSLGERAKALGPQAWTVPALIDHDARSALASGERAVLAHALAASAIETAEAIRRIARVAAEHHIPIRWFDFGAFEHGEPPHGGVDGLFVPLNAVEVAGRFRGSESPAMLTFSLKLSEQNVSALVFQRPETPKEPSVFFIADSRLAFGVDKPKRDFPKHCHPSTRPVVFTAAHHGSRNNDKAYDVLTDWLGQAFFDQSFAIRNGGMAAQKFDAFWKIDKAKRRCAQCIQCQGKNWSQLVQLSAQGGQWQAPCGVACPKP